jgi:hypothetical protein
VTVVFWQLLSHSPHAQRVCVMRATPWKSSKYWELLSAFPLTKASADQKVLSLRLSDMLLFARAHTSAAVRRMKKHQKWDYLCDDEPRWKFFHSPFFFSVTRTACKKHDTNTKEHRDRQKKKTLGHIFIYIFYAVDFPKGQAIFARSRRLASGDLAQGTLAISRKWHFCLNGNCFLDLEIWPGVAPMPLCEWTTPSDIGSMLLNIVLNGRYQCK